VNQGAAARVLALAREAGFERAVVMGRLMAGKSGVSVRA
jgi:hypothetical protein